MRAHVRLAGKDTYPLHDWQNADLNRSMVTSGDLCEEIKSMKTALCGPISYLSLADKIHSSSLEMHTDQNVPSESVEAHVTLKVPNLLRN